MFNSDNESDLSVCLIISLPGMYTLLVLNLHQAQAYW